MEQGRIGMIHLPSRRTDGSSLSSYRYSHPPPPPTRNSMNQPSSLLGVLNIGPAPRSEEHTSELQSLMRISYAVFRLKKHTSLIAPYAVIHLHTRENYNT